MTRQPLDKIFCGDKGVVKYLHDILGGEAVVTYVGGRTFDEYRKVWNTSDDVSITVPFVPYPITTKNETLQKMFLEKNIVISGTIPTVSLTQTIKIEKDKLTYQNIEYIIAWYETESASNETMFIKVYGRK